MGTLHGRVASNKSKAHLGTIAAVGYHMFQSFVPF